MSEAFATDLDAQAADTPGKLRMTYEEFLAWATEDVHAEWVNGEVIVPMPPKDPHQTLLSFLDTVLSLFITAFDLGRSWIAPFEVKLWPGGPAREPDFIFLAKEHLDRLSPERISGAPDLVIEIVSNDSVQRDRVDKLDEYEQAGIPEYWVLDNRPGQNRALFYQLDASGSYQRIKPDPEGVYQSKMLKGLRLRVDALWDADPDKFRALAEIIGPDRLASALRAAVQPKR